MLVPPPFNYTSRGTLISYIGLPPCLRPLQEEKEPGTVQNKNVYTYQGSKMDVTQAWPSDSHISPEPDSLWFSKIKDSHSLRDLKPRRFHLLYLQPGKIASLTKKLNPQKSSHLDASSLLPWLHLDSATFSGQSQLPSVSKDTSYVAFLGEQKHQFQANHGEFAA